MLKLSLATTLFLSVAGSIMDSPTSLIPNSPKKEKFKQVLTLIQEIQEKVEKTDKNGISNDKTTFTEHKTPIPIPQTQT